MLQNRNIEFVGRLKIFAAISLSIIIIGLVVAFVFGVELDIGYRGGTILTYSYDGYIDLDDVQSVVADELNMLVNVSESQDLATGARMLVITLATNENLTTYQQLAVSDALEYNFPDNDIGGMNMRSVSARAGAMLFAMSLYAVGLASVLVIIYLGIRFRKIGGFSAGVTALIALIHDVSIAFFAFVILRIPIGDNFFAVVLIILGYSLNSNIVIYDRIRENRKLKGNSQTLRQTTNGSINSTLNRVVVTTATTFMTCMVIVIVAFVRGLDSIIYFALPMGIGVLAGGYSSVFLAAPMWVTWNEFRDRRRSKKGPKSKGSSKPKSRKKSVV